MHELSALPAFAPLRDDLWKRPDWPRTPGTESKLVAQSMAGAEWDLTPSSSREYIRHVRPHRKRGSRFTRLKAKKVELKGRRGRDHGIMSFRADCSKAIADVLSGQGSKAPYVSGWGG